MKMIVHRDPVSEAEPFVTDDVRSALRLEPDESELVAEANRIALAAAMDVEGFAQIALLTQSIRVTIFEPRQEYATRLPIGPVAQDHVPTVTIDGEPFTAFEVEGGNRAYLRWLAPYYELTPSRMVITYTAGFGDTAQHIPSDLAQAVLDQVALLFDGRSPVDAKHLTSSPHMARIGARYRGVRA